MYNIDLLRNPRTVVHLLPVFAPALPRTLASVLQLMCLVLALIELESNTPQWTLKAKWHWLCSCAGFL